MQERLLITLLALVACLLFQTRVSYAAPKVPANSVGAKQIKNNSITGAKIKDGTLTARDFAAGELPAGPQGPQGVAGPQGLPGTLDRSLFATTAIFMGVDFHPVASNQEYSVASRARFQLANPDFLGFLAPLRLPQGATITHITWLYSDVDTTVDRNLTMQLTRSSSDSANATLSTISSAANPGLGKTQVATLSPGVEIDNTTYVYYLRAEFGSSTNADVLLLSATVSYTLP